MKVLITGGAGYGGSGLAKALLDRGHKITILDTVSPLFADNLREEIDKGAVAYKWMAVHDVSPSDVNGYDVICGFAAQPDVPMAFPSPYYTAWQNVMGTLRLLEAVSKAGCDKFILPSTGNVFGRPPKLPIDETCAPICHNPYSASKASQENLAWAYHHSYNVPIVIYRNGIVYGGESMRRDIFLYKWLYNILRNEPIVVEGGDQTRDPCYVTDTIAAWTAGVEARPKDVVGEIFQVSKGDEYSIDEIAYMCLEASGIKVPITHAPYRPGEDGQRECFDISKARRVLNYDPQVNLAQGLEKMVAMMKDTLM